MNVAKDIVDHVAAEKAYPTWSAQYPPRRDPTGTTNMTKVRIEDNPIPTLPSGSLLTKKFIAEIFISTTEADHIALEIAVKVNAGMFKMITIRNANVEKT